MDSSNDYFASAEYGLPRFAGVLACDDGVLGVFPRIHFSFMDCHAVQAVLPMTEKGLLQKAYFTSYDSKGY